MEKKKFRQRNVRTARKAVESRPKAQQRPLWLKITKGVFLPVVWVFKWLNQPVRTHADHGEGAMAGLTKQRSLIPAYVKESAIELKHVSWPSFPAAMRLTFAVFWFAVFFALLVTALDWVLTQIFEELILNKGESIRDLF